MYVHCTVSGAGIAESRPNLIEITGSLFHSRGGGVGGEGRGLTVTSWASLTRYVLCPLRSTIKYCSTSSSSSIRGTLLEFLNNLLGLGAE
jgi:hypothetical protein